MMSDTPEGKVKKNIKKWMKKVFPTAFRFMPRQSGYGDNGIPDFIYCIPTVITQEMVGKELGVFVGIEAKTRDGSQSALQRIKEGEIIESSGEYLLVYGSDDIPNALETLYFYASNP